MLPGGWLRFFRSRRFVIGGSVALAAVIVAGSIGAYRFQAAATRSAAKTATLPTLSPISGSPTAVAVLSATPTASPTPAAKPTAPPAPTATKATVKSTRKPTPKKTTAAPKPAATTATPAKTYPGVTWGITVNLFPFPNLFDDKRFQQVVQEQIDYLKQSDVQVVRFEYSIENPSRSAYVAQQLKAAGIQTCLVVEDYINGPQANEYDHGYNFTKDAIEKIKAAGGSVSYYQLANEIGGSAIKGPQYNGQTLDQYDPTKLDNTLNFVKGASQAVADFDPSAQRIVSINSTDTAIIAEAIKRGIPFEILGWNWFSDFGTNLTSKDGYPFMDVMKSFHKTLWVTELSRRGGASDGDEAAQAAFLRQAIPIAYKAGFRGIFPFLLLEDVVGSGGAGYGLVQPVKTDGVWAIDRPRQVFNDFAAIVKANR